MGGKTKGKKKVTFSNESVRVDRDIVLGVSERSEPRGYWGKGASGEVKNENKSTFNTSLNNTLPMMDYFKGR